MAGMDVVEIELHADLSASTSSYAYTAPIPFLSRMRYSCSLPSHNRPTPSVPCKVAVDSGTSLISGPRSKRPLPVPSCDCDPAVVMGVIVVALIFAQQKLQTTSTQL